VILVLRTRRMLTGDTDDEGVLRMAADRPTVMLGATAPGGLMASAPSSSNFAGGSASVEMFATPATVVPFGHHW